MQSGTGKKSNGQVEELKRNEKFLKKKRKLDEDNSAIIIKRNDYSKPPANQFGRSINQILDSDDAKCDLSSDSEQGNFFEKKFKNNLKEKDLIGSAHIQIVNESSSKKKKKKKSESPELPLINVDVSLSKNPNFNKLSVFEAQTDFIEIPSKENNNNNNNPPVTTIQSVEESEFPWLSEKSIYERGMLKLHWEIIEFYEFIKPTNEEDLLREKSYQILKKLINENFKDLQVKKFGSFPNKIHLPDSDIDLVVISSDENQDQLKILKKITQKLIDNNLVDYIRIIEARVPIIRATLKATKINLDIRKNGYEAKKVIKRTLEDFPHMRPLIYVLKYFLRQRKLNESYTGGISSFLLFNLILSYIYFAMKEKEKHVNSLGHLLTGFLQFYSFVFNFEEVGISVRHGGFFYKKSESKLFDHKRNSLLSVENFQELDQDVGKGSFKFRKVLDCFKQARDALYYPSVFPIQSYIGSFITTDSFLKERAQKLKQYNNKLNI